MEMDDAVYHLESIHEKDLQVDEITAYNHMAIYLCWCMKHDLMGEDFIAEYDEVVKQVQTDPCSIDLRVFISNPAQNLYKRFGFAVYDKTRSHYLMKYTGE